MGRCTKLMSEKKMFWERRPVHINRLRDMQKYYNVILMQALIRSSCFLKVTKTLLNFNSLHVKHWQYLSNCIYTCMLNVCTVFWSIKMVSLLDMNCLVLWAHWKNGKCSTKRHIYINEFSPIWVFLHNNYET